MAEGSPRVDIFAADGISGSNHCHDHLDGVVDHFECAIGRTGEPKLNDESRESALVFSRATGNAGVLRSLDCRRGHADAHHFWTDGDSVYRHQPCGMRLLHLETAQVCHRNISFWIYRPVGVNDLHWDLHSRPWLAMVLAGADLGPQSPHL